MSPPVSPNRCDGIELSNAEFEDLRRLVYERSGIHLGHHKRALLRARLIHRLRKLALPSFRAYYEFLTADPGGTSEQTFMLDAISTNLTEFFREPQHFQHLREQFFPRWQNEGTLRILSAGCSSGEEPYTIALCALAHFGERAPFRVEIHAGDLSRRMLAIAQAGIYLKHKAGAIPPEQLKAYFLNGTGNSAGLIRVKPELRRLVKFEPLNLTADLPFRLPFHAIFCRNVAIYFDSLTQRAVFSRLGGHLVRGGTLFLGHSESLTNRADGWRYVQPTVYEKE